MQKLWAHNLTWDQPLPHSILDMWLEFSSELDTLNEIKIKRKITCDQPKALYLHGFSDASEASYGACVYVVSRNLQGRCESHLLCAKSKVAPLKSVTIPRLELCAALILSRLISNVLNSLQLKFEHIYCWSDSTIVLGWIRTSPSLLKPFVNSRVAEIQSLTNSFEWRHVPTKENPADLVSRGLRPKQIVDSHMWWHRPNWLLQDESDWPSLQINDVDVPDVCSTVLLTTTPQLHFPFERFSNLCRLKRTVAFVYRFIHNSHNKLHPRKFSYLTVSEIKTAFTKIIKIAQLASFPSEYAILSSKKELSSTSKILSLHPFLDDEGLIRVGGRLAHSDFSYSKKYPIL